MTELATTDKAKAAVVIDAAIARVKQGWTQCAFARDKAGNIVWWHDEDASEWCLLGALNIGARDAGLLYHVDHFVLTAIQDVVGTTCTDFNDAEGRTQADVVDALERAKERLETED